MAVKTYGKLLLTKEGDKWIMERCEPHVSIKLKALFNRIPKGDIPPYNFENTPENCHDLKWFMQRYPLEISNRHKQLMHSQSQRFTNRINDLERLLLPEHHPRPITLKDGLVAREYQLRGCLVHLKSERMLNGDDLGLGKTLTGTLSFLDPRCLPGLVVVQTHLAFQWKSEIEKFTNLSVYIIKGTKPYNLPKADVYIIRYSCLASWSDVLAAHGFIKYTIFDEIQEMRHEGTNKYNAGQAISIACEYTQGLSASPIYNYGDEIFNVMDLLKPGCLGDRYDFLREWCTPIGNGKYKVKDPSALGTYLREKFLMLRRTRAEVGMELPQINKIVHTVGYDSHEVKKVEDIAKALAMQVVRGSFVERGQAARELNIKLRQYTGLSKAREVATYVKMILETGEPVVLAGWHREVYSIWQEELKDYNPVLYTGSESPKQKMDAFNKFTSGETNLFIISLRSGAGLDGLQHRCKLVVIGELDYSPKVHDQLIGRVDRPGQEDQVTVIYLVSDWGSDPPIINLLGLKAAQSHGIIDPMVQVQHQHTDESRIKYIAEMFLKKQVG